MKLIKKGTCLLLSMILSAFPVLCAHAQNGKTPKEWLDPYNTVQKADNGVTMFGNATYKTALNPDYISVDLTFKKFNPNIDCWIALSFINAPKEAPIGSGHDLPGIYFLLRNSGGQLNVQCFEKIGTANIFYETLSISTIGAPVPFKFFKDGSAYKISIGNVEKTLTGLETADFTTSGKTYLAMTAFDQQSDAPNNRAWVVSNIVNKKPVSTAAKTTKAATTENKTEATNTTDPTVDTSTTDSSETLSTTSNGLATNKDGNGTNNTGLIIAIVVIVVLLGGGAVAFFLIKKKKKV